MDGIVAARLAMAIPRDGGTPAPTKQESRLDEAAPAISRTRSSFAQRE
jgi:hypothetical protein